MPIHTRLVQDALEKWDLRFEGVANRLFSTSKKICCLGAGPGSDVFGILRYVHYNCTERPKLEFKIYDRAHLWDDTWNSIWDVLDNKYDTRVTTCYTTLDLSQKETTLLLDNMSSTFIKYDIFTLIKFWSSIFKSDISRIHLQDILSQAKIGAYILYIDNGYGPFTQNFIDCLPNWSVIIQTNTDHHLFKDEQKRYLSEYLCFFGGRSPIFKTTIDTVILKKIRM
jgi:hypothetical protein